MIRGRLPHLLLATLATALLLIAGTSGPATGHEGEGALEVLAAEPSGPLEVDYRVRLTYVADGHGAPDATVTAAPQGPAGAAAPPPTPLAATDEEGVYAATVRFPSPGAWTVRFTAVTPPATVERAETVAPPPTTTTTTTTAPSTTSTTSTTAPAGGGSGDGDDGSPALPVAAAVVVGAALAAGGWQLTRRRRAGA